MCFSATRVKNGWKSFDNATSSKTLRASVNRLVFQPSSPTRSLSFDISSSAISRTRSAVTIAPSSRRDACFTHCHTCDREISAVARSEEHTSELQSLRHLVCRLLLEKK